MLQNRRRHPFPPWASLPLGSCSRTPISVAGDHYAGLNSVLCRSIACMTMASRRASAIRAFRMVDRLPMASAHSFNFRGPLYTRFGG